MIPNPAGSLALFVDSGTAGMLTRLLTLIHSFSETLNPFRGCEDQSTPTHYRALTLSVTPYGVNLDSPVSL